MNSFVWPEMTDGQLDYVLYEGHRDYVRYGEATPTYLLAIKEYGRRNRTSKGLDRRGNV